MDEAPKQEVIQTPEMSPVDILNELRSERTKIEQARDEIRKMSAEQTKIYTSMVMGGRTLAGSEPVKEKTNEEKAQEAADALIKRYWRA